MRCADQRVSAPNQIKDASLRARGAAAVTIRAAVRAAEELHAGTGRTRWQRCERSGAVGPGVRPAYFGTDQASSEAVPGPGGGNRTRSCVQRPCETVRPTAYDDEGPGEIDDGAATRARSPDGLVGRYAGCRSRR